ncbi:amino acid adenylation domain-containing protein [Croceitalea marina]|uniref:Amino acid adenylation domain-containing protein n=1 Tax=Croceitalea marina TaxID=1775166 RepID=A0ABW5MTQ3_9FLAO
MKTIASYHQQRMWFIDNFENDYLYDGGPVYHNIPLAIEIKQSITENALKDAFARLLRNHEILRTQFILGNDTNIYQKIVPIQDIDLNKLLIKKEQIFQNAEVYRMLPFDYGKDFLLRGYYEINQDATHLLLILNQAIVDKYSLKKIREFFLDVLEEKGLTKTPQIVQFQSFSNWQNGLDGNHLEPLLFYWKAQLKDIQILYFSTDYKREHIHIYKSNSLQLVLPKKKILEFCTQHGGSVKEFMLAMFKMVLYKFTSLNDVVVGSILSLRPKSEKILLGPVDNIVVLKSNIEPQKNVLENYKEVRRTWKMAEKYKSIPFDKLVSEINPKKDRSRTALFDIFFHYDLVNTQNTEQERKINNSNLGWGKYDLNLLVSEETNNLLLTLTYNDLYFKEYTIESLLNAYKKLIFESIANYNLQLEAFDIPINGGGNKLLTFPQNVLSEQNNQLTITSEFFAQVIKRGENPALVGSGLRSLSYKELDNQSNRLSNLLRSKLDIHPGDKVAALLPKNDELIITLLSILKLGATYVPIDPNYPEERKLFILSDSKCKLTIDEGFFITWRDKVKTESEVFEAIAVQGDTTAYIIYTSGTTGKPKGVRVSHSNVVSLLHSCYANIKVSVDDTWVQFHSYCFDFSVWEIFGCLMTGGKLLMITPAEARDIESLCQLMNRYEATIFSQTPSAFYNFINYESLKVKLRYVILGGEMLLPNKLKEWSDNNPEVKLINMYGITETSVHVTFKELGVNDMTSELSNIGVPLSFARVYILNQQLQLLPYGRIGEMYVGGNGVAQGYLNRPKLEEERFLPDPYQEGKKMYRTGDKARWLPNGELEFIGRVDRQVKIRGYRIELDEIENTISQFSNSVQQVAVESKIINQEAIIVAYYVSKETFPESEIRNFLQKKLPEYMVPGFFVELDSMKLTSNGKIDREALQDICKKDLLKREYVAPRNEIEEKLASIWKEILGIQQVSITDDFFELGGHSLKIIMMKTRIRNATGIDLDISNFFDHSILSDLAKFISDKLGKMTDLPALESVPAAREYKSTKAQQRLWFIHQLKQNKSAYNIAFALSLSGTFHFEAFQKALNFMFGRHEILRTVFNESNQVIRPSKECLVDLLEMKQGEDLKDKLLKIAMAPFDLEKGPLLKVTVLRASDKVRYLLFNIHHIIFDDWSVTIFIKELLTLYESFIQNKAPKLKPITYQYKEYAHWKNKIAQSDWYKVSEKYWLEQYRESIQVLEFKYDFPRPRRKTFNGNNLFLEIEQDLVKRIQSKISRERLSTVSFFLACFKILLYKYTNQNDIAVGIPVSDRDHSELEDQIGLYLNVIAVRSKLKTSSVLNEVLHHEHQTLLKALDHKEYSFDELVEKLNKNRDISRSPLFDVMFAHQFEDQILPSKDSWNFGGLQIEQIQLNPPTSKFDLLLNLVESTSRFRLRFSYNSDLFEKSTIQQMMDHFVSILDVCSGTGTTSIVQLSILSKEEKNSLYPRRETTKINHISLFLRNQLKLSPDNIVVRYGEEEYNFKTFHQLAENMASALYQDYGLREGDRIAVFSKNPVIYPLSLLAIIKLGACYLPLDAKTPEKRRAFILNEAKPKIIIIDKEVTDDISPYKTVYCSELRKELKNKVVLDSTNLDNESFIIYTSGTTGIPKGIIHSYHNISNLIQWQRKNLDVLQSDGYLQFAAFTFDVSIQDIIFCLATGLTIHLPNEEERRDFDKLFAFIGSNKISILSLPFSVLRSFVTAIDLDKLDRLNLKHIITYGEQLIVTKKLGAFLKRNPNVQVHNYYGPSETHVITFNTFSGTEPLEEYQNIGKPISNNDVYLLDENLQPVPKGVVGTLYFGGKNIFLHYVDKNLPSNKYDIPMLYKGGPLYNTGDLAYWRADGKLQYYGRKDQQIKIDGNRVEVREIERVLANYKDVEESVILCLKKSGNYSLHGFYVSKAPIFDADIKEFIAKFLPPYMIPQTISRLEAVPTNKNGKVDWRQLESMLPSSATLADANLTTQLSETGKVLKSIWEDNLGVSINSPDSNYFELGGHSLSAMILLNQVREQFNCAMDIEDIFEHRIFSRMIHFITQATTSLRKEIPRVKEKIFYPLSPAQLSFWLKIQNQMDKEAHNIALSFRLKGVIQIKALKEALMKVVERHEILRTVFVLIDGEPHQQILNRDDLDYDIEVVQTLLPQNRWSEAIQLDTSFQIDTWPLFNFKLTEVSAEVKLVQVEIHHLISDGWSIELFIKELIGYYYAIINDEVLENFPPKIQYKDYSAWINGIKDSQIYKNSEDYWKKNLSNLVYQDSFRKLRICEATSSLDGTNFVFEIPKHSALTQFTERQQVSPYILVLSALFLLHYKYSKQTDFIIPSVSAGRIHKDIEKIMGYFLNSYFLRILLEHQMSLSELIRQVKDISIKALKHQVYSFEEMISIINEEKRLIPDKPLYELGVTYQKSVFSRDHKIDEVQLNQLDFAPFPPKVIKVKDPLWWYFTEHDQNILVDIHFNTEIYKVSAIRNLVNDFNDLFGSLIQSPLNRTIEALCNSRNESFAEMQQKAYQKIESDF